MQDKQLLFLTFLGLVFAFFPPSVWQEKTGRAPHPLRPAPAASLTPGAPVRSDTEHTALTQHPKASPAHAQVQETGAILHLC